MAIDEFTPNTSRTAGSYTKSRQSSLISRGAARYRSPKDSFGGKGRNALRRFDPPAEGRGPQPLARVADDLWCPTPRAPPASSERIKGRSESSEMGDDYRDLALWGAPRRSRTVGPGE